jgi:uncharacterized membrane protein
MPVLAQQAICFRGKGFGSASIAAEAAPTRAMAMFLWERVYPRFTAARVAAEAAPTRVTVMLL